MSIVCYNIYSRTVLASLDAAAEEIDKHLDEATKKELDKAAEETLFIPFPGTTRQVAPKPYKASDPEWKEYVKFSQKPELGNSIRRE